MLERARAALRRQGRAGLAGLACAIIYAAGSIGPPLVGIGSFHAASTLRAIPPFADEATTPVDTSFAPSSDTYDAIAPGLIEFGRAARHGQVAWISPYEVGGEPIGAVPQPGDWDPMNVPWLVLPPRLAPAFAKLAELAVAIGFTYLFCRRLCRSPAASWLAGVVFAGSGFQVAWTNWPHTHAGALIPALFWSAERCIQTRRAGAAAAFGLIVAWSVTTGFPVVSLMAGELTAFYIVARIVALRPRMAWRAWVGIGGMLSASTVAGVALVLPLGIGLRQQLSATNLGYREAFRGLHLTTEAMVTSVVPFAFGNPQWVEGGRFNFIESQSYIGCAAIVLAAVGFVRRPPTGLPRAARTFFASAAVVIGLALYASSAVTRVVQLLPGVGGSVFGRARVLLGFAVAVLAAMGLDTLTDPSTRRTPRAARWVGAVIAAGGVVAVGAVVALIVPVDRALVPAVVMSVVGGVAALVLCAVAMAQRRGRPDLAIATVCAAVTMQALTLAVPFWNRGDTFYPTSATIDTLVGLQGLDRAEAIGALGPGVNAYYGLRTATGHTFHTREWADLLRASERGVFTRPTVSAFKGVTRDVYASPALDRLAVRYVLVGRYAVVPGAAAGLEPDAPLPKHEVPAGQWVSASAEIGDLRAVGILLREPVELDAPVPRIEAELLDRNGAVVARNTRTVTNHGQGWFEIAVDPGDARGRGTIRVRMTGTSVPVPVPDGDVIRTVRADDKDEMAMVAALPGGAIFVRPHAMSRYRWADRSVVVTEGTERVAMLAAGDVPDDTVVLNSGRADHGGGDGSVMSVDEGDPNDRLIRTTSDGPGYLVVADSFRSGWTAVVDGRSVDVVHGDHAMMAVPVPAGEHTVRLSFGAPGGRRARIVMVGAALGLVGVPGLSRARDRRRRRAGAAATE